MFFVSQVSNSYELIRFVWFSLKNLDEDKKSKLISGPTNFSHVSHMGPTAGLPILRDLVSLS